MKVRDFIQQFMIDEIGSIMKNHPFHSFVLMSIGIEFLGKCLREADWDDNTQPRKDFDEAISQLKSLNKYSSIDDLYDKLRCGLAHLCVPKVGIKIDRDGNDLNASTPIIGCREFYEDFKQACTDVIDNKEGMVKKDLDKEYADIEGRTTGSTVVSKRVKK